MTGREKFAVAMIELWSRLLSQTTARFILALLSLNFAGVGFVMILDRGIPPNSEQIITFALGQLFALPFMAFGFYFSSNSHEKAQPTGNPGDPVHTQEES